MGPLGVPDAEWSVGYGTTTTVDGLPLVATWGGGSYSPNAVARVGRLMLHKGDWEGRRLLSPSVIETVTQTQRPAGPFGAGVVGERAAGGTSSGSPPPRMRSGVPGPVSNSSWSSPAWT